MDKEITKHLRLRRYLNGKLSRCAHHTLTPHVCFLLPSRFATIRAALTSSLLPLIPEVL